MQCILQDLSLARRHIISNFLALFSSESDCGSTLGAAGGWAGVINCLATA